MRILLLGGGGLVGNIFIKYYQNITNNKHDLGATFSENQSIYDIQFNEKKVDTFFNVDAFNYKSILDSINTYKPDAILNTIGVTKQIANNNDPKLSIYLNSYFPHLLCATCNEKNIKLIHLSTDCIFSGSRGNYSEEDIPDASDIYGKTKFLGELQTKNALTLRTSILGPEIRRFLGIYSWFIKQSNQVYGFDKAFFSGITSLELSKIIIFCLENCYDLTGIYNISSIKISKYELLNIVRDIKKLNIKIQKSANEIYDRSLNGAKFISETGYLCPSWEDMINEMIKYEKF